jgi:hypothetical protein
VSFNNLNAASRTLATRIWAGIKDDKRVSEIIQSPEQISFLSPKDAAELKPPQISVYLYNFTELTSMRNQPTPTQNPSKPSLFLNLRYLITPLTQNIETNQMLLGKILQVFYDTPILRGSDLQGSLSESGEDLKIMLDTLSMDELSKLWAMISAPYRLSVGYTVYPVKIDPSVTVKPDSKPVILKGSPSTVESLTIRKTPVKA